MRSVTTLYNIPRSRAPSNFLLFQLGISTRYHTSHSAFASLVACQMENYHFADPAITTSPSEDEEDNAEFYDAQESDTFTVTIPIATSNSISHARDRTDSQGSDDGSSSEGDPTPLPVSDSTGTDSFLIVTDSTATQTLSAVRITNDLDIVSILHSFSSFLLSNKMTCNVGCRCFFFFF